MNNEVINTVVESFPYIGAAAGVAAGSAAVYDVRRSLAQKRGIAGLEAHVDVAAEDHGKLKGLYKRLATPALALVVYSGVAGGITEMALRNDYVEVDTKPNVELVVDHSYGVAKKKDGGNGSVTLIDSIATQMLNNDKIEATAHIANGDAYIRQTQSAGTVQKDSEKGVFTGSKSLVKATERAVDNAGSKVSVTPGESKGAAVVVLTDGSTVGPAKVVINHTKQIGGAPLYIANTGLATSAAAKNLKHIAKETGGKYWNIDKSNADEVSAKISETFEPRKIEVDNAGQRMVLGLLAGMLALTAIKDWRIKRDDTFNAKLK